MLCIHSLYWQHIHTPYTKYEYRTHIIHHIDIARPCPGTASTGKGCRRRKRTRSPSSSLRSPPPALGQPLQVRDVPEERELDHLPAHRALLLYELLSEGHRVEFRADIALNPLERCRR